MGGTIRLSLAHGHEMLREGLGHLLSQERDLQVAESGADGAAALAACRSGEIDLLLASAGLTDPTLLELLRQLVSEGNPTRVLVLGEDHDLDPEAAIRAGAWGQLGQGAGVGELVAAIRAVAAGEIWASREFLTRLVRASLSAKDAARTGKKNEALSPREAEVLRLVALGHTNDRIAELLFVEASTVKTHLVRVFKKLGVSDRTTAVFIAARAGQIQIETAAETLRTGPPFNGSASFLTR